MRKIILLLVVGALLVVMVPAEAGSDRGRWTSSTAYCLKGNTASGPTTTAAYNRARRHGADGIVAMPHAEFGTRFKLVGGSLPAGMRGAVLEVVDRPAEFDVWVADCSRAVNWWGRRTIKIRRLYSPKHYPKQAYYSGHRRRP